MAVKFNKKKLNWQTLFCFALSFISIYHSATLHCFRNAKASLRLFTVYAVTRGHLGACPRGTHDWKQSTVKQWLPHSLIPLIACQHLTL